MSYEFKETMGIDYSLGFYFGIGHNVAKASSTAPLCDFAILNNQMQSLPRRLLSTKKLARFSWTDPLNLESCLTSEERAVRDSCASYCQSKLAPRVQDAFRNESKLYYINQ
jgi:hypothetical protein